MSASIWQELVIILLLLMANGFFAAAEIAIVAARKGRLQAQADDGDRSAKIALDLANDPGRFLPTVQLGITIVGTLAAAIGGAHLVAALTEALRSVPLAFIANYGHTLALITVVLGISYFEVLVGELIPKRLALRDPAAFARFVARPIRFFAIVGQPAVKLLDASTNAFMRAVNIKVDAEHSVQREDIEHLLEEGVSGGLLDRVEQQVAVEAMRLGDRSARDIMLPRIEIDGLDVDTPPNEVLGVIAMAGFSRLPVYEGDLDHILGFVHAKDVLRQIHLGWKLDLRKLLLPALFVPESLPLDRLLVRFREAKTHLAVVLDEHGGTEGIVSLDRVVEVLVGQVADDHERDDADQIVRRDDGSLLIDGVVKVEEFLDALALPQSALPTPRTFTTAAGLVLYELGQLPRVGQKLEFAGFGIEVVDMDGQRIDRLLVTPPAKPGIDRKAEAVTSEAPADPSPAGTHA